ncbi:MAG: PHP domain-containing protein [Dehalococcoidia bacterium]
MRTRKSELGTQDSALRTQHSAIDLHVHTVVGSADSSLSVEQMVYTARRVGLHGVVVTEHMTRWTRERTHQLAAEHRLFVSGASEWTSDQGHMLVFGVDRMAGYSGPATEMRKIVDDHRGMMILAHPFRYFPGTMNFLFARWRGAERMTPEQLAEHPVFALVDEIEVLNNGCTDKENDLALRVARVLGKRGTAGSDAHSLEELGQVATIFDAPLATEEDLLRELRRGRFTAARRSATGEFAPYQG